MKSVFLLVSVFTIVLTGTGCLKGAESNPCTNKLVSSEEAVMDAYAANNGITASVHSSGIRYQVITPGTGPTPTGTSTIWVKYSAKYVFNNSLFDEALVSTNVGQLNGLIEGWRIGLPLINEGGKIKLILPSSLAYGCLGRAPIPADAVLYFEIELVDVQ